MDSLKIAESLTDITNRDDERESTVKTTSFVDPAGSPGGGGEEDLPEAFNPDLPGADADQLSADPGGEKEKSSAKKEKDNFPAFPFSDFWEWYDKKVARETCAKLWAKLPKSDKLQILSALPAYLEDTSGAREQYRVNPAKYLKEKRYFDEIKPQTETSKQTNETRTRKDERAVSTGSALAALRAGRR